MLGLINFSKNKTFKILVQVKKIWTPHKRKRATFVFKPHQTLTSLMTMNSSVMKSKKPEKRVVPSILMLRVEPTQEALRLLTLINSMISSNHDKQILHKMNKNTIHQPTMALSVIISKYFHHSREHLWTQSKKKKASNDEKKLKNQINYRTLNQIEIK